MHAIYYLFWVKRILQIDSKLIIFKNHKSKAFLSVQLQAQQIKNHGTHPEKNIIKWFVNPNQICIVLFGTHFSRTVFKH